jgi:hypothetical protein
MFERDHDDPRIIVLRLPRLFRRKPTASQRANRYFRQITERNRWKAIATSASQQPIRTKFRKYFHTYWTEAGRAIREQIDDDNLVAGLLRKLLPPYHGPARTLYRGENLDRYRAGRIGFCWTESTNVARMFGRGLNAVGSGGVLLETNAGTDSIIAGPSEHSLHLGEAEFTVDPKSLAEIRELENHPSIGGEAKYKQQTTD